MDVNTSGRLTEDVGRHIRALRTAAGVSLSELSRQAGVGKATLSQLEAGVRNPTLETLYALTTALGLPLTAALPSPGDAPGGGAAAPLRGRAVTAHLLERFDDRDVVSELYRVSIQAGAVQTSEPHAPGVTEHLTVWRGTALAGPVDSPSEVPAGRYVSWAADTPHVYAAVGQADAEGVLLVRYPAPPEPVTGGRGRSAPPG